MTEAVPFGFGPQGANEREDRDIVLTLSLSYVERKDSVDKERGGDASGYVAIASPNPDELISQVESPQTNRPAGKHDAGAGPHSHAHVRAASCHR